MFCGDLMLDRFPCLYPLGFTRQIPVPSFQSDYRSSAKRAPLNRAPFAVLVSTQGEPKSFSQGSPHRLTCRDVAW